MSVALEIRATYPVRINVQCAGVMHKGVGCVNFWEEPDTNVGKIPRTNVHN